MYNLAWEFRPKTLQDFVGQTHLLNDNAPLKIILEKNNNNEQNMLPNLIFFLVLLVAVKQVLPTLLRQ